MENTHEILQTKCKRYLLEEPNASLRSEIEGLLASTTEQDAKELFDRMNCHLRFGTAGLRAKMEGGYNRMNNVSVYRFCHALFSQYCNKLGSEKLKRVVIGFDGRENSECFAQEASLILSLLGIKIYLFKQSIPTPLCAYATKKLNATFGIMITASHNPKFDNGIKLYDESSAQCHGSIIKSIENDMDLAPLRSEFLASHQHGSLKSNIQNVGDEIFRAYLKDIKTTRLIENSIVDHDLCIVYTPLHGTGKKYFIAVLSQEGFDDVIVVPEQGEPDGKFPTVFFPNPEENNALDYAHKLALDKGCQWVFANDPDADRLQVSCLDETGQFKKLSGNEMGSILGYFAIRRAKELGIKPLLSSSIVSSRLLRTICKKLDAKYTESLTGFSNIVAAAIAAQIDGYQFVFGYEEAIGFLIGQVVLDKDGLNAGARFMEVAGYLKRNNQTIWQLIDELYLSFGIFMNDQWSNRFDGISAMQSMTKFMSQVRKLSVSSVANCFGASTCRKYDLSLEQKNNCYEGLFSDVVVFEIEKRARLVFRPSGTEPKVKIYLELFGQVTNKDILRVNKTILAKNLKEYRGNIEKLFGA